jgi:CRP-like cAMP-binding protein
VAVVKKCLSKLEYAKFVKNKYVMKQGDEGDSYFIILQGNVQILQNKLVEEEFEWQQLMQRVVDDYEDIVDDDKKQEVLKELRYYYKTFIKVKEVEGKEVLYIDT